MRQHQSRLSAVGLLGLAVGVQGFAPLVLSHGRRLQLRRTAATTVAITSSSSSSSTTSNYHYHQHRHNHDNSSNGIRSSSLPFHACSSALARSGAGLLRLRTRKRPGQVMSAVALSSPSMEPEAERGCDGVVELIEEGEEKEEAPRKKRTAVSKKNAVTTKAKTTTGAEKKAKKTPARKATPKAKVGKKKTKKGEGGEGDDEKDPEAGRRKLTMEGLAAAEQGVALPQEDEFDGWDFVEEGEEDDEDDEVPFWTGTTPTFNKEGKLQGIPAEAVRIANKAFNIKDDNIDTKVQTDEDFHWYLLRCFATYELRCRDSVDGLLHAWGLGDRVEDVWVPTRQVPKQVGKTVTFKEEPIYQGYIYCKVKMSVELRDLVNDMERIVGFVGDRRDENMKLIPNRIDTKDIDGVKESEAMLGGNQTPVLLGVGDLVEIVEGPFKTKNGEISKIKDGEYVVKVNTFGRNSDVRLSWEGVRRLTELEVESWFEDTRRALDATYTKREARRRGNGTGRGKGRGFDERGGRGRGEGLRGFGGAELGARWEAGREGEEDPLARKRFMEKDLELLESDSRRPVSAPRLRRPSGEKVDEELPQEAFESVKDSDSFFDSLDGILRGDEEEEEGNDRRRPALPGARVQDLSVVERAHAVASAKTPSISRSERSTKQIGTGSAGSLEAGVARVRRDTPVTRSEGGGSGLEDIAAPDANDDDDDFFSALMQSMADSTANTTRPSTR